MPINLKEMAEPAITALVIHEMQEGVVGKSVPGPLRQLADVVDQRDVAGHLSRLLSAARRSGVKVFHCPAFSRPDTLGSMTNTPCTVRSRSSARAISTRLRKPPQVCRGWNRYPESG